MPFDLSTAKPVSSAPSNGGFDLSSAKPVTQQDDYEPLYQKYVKYYNDTANQVPIPGTPPVDQGPLLSKEQWKERNDKRFRNNLLSIPLAIGEQALNLAGGVAGAIPSVLGAGGKAINDLSQGRDTSFEKDYSQLFGEASSIGTKLADMTGINTGARGAISQNVGNFMNRVGIPMAGLNLPHINKNAELRRAMPELAGQPEVPRIPNKVLDNLDKQSGFDLKTAKPVEEIPQSSTAMTPSQLKEWADLQEKYAAYKRGELPEQKQAAAQAAIDARQKALEQDVARQGGLDRNAAERARQEAAPTGYAEWLESQRQGANQRLPGDNTPMDLGPGRLTRANQYPDVNDFPGLLQDAPYQYEGGIDYTAPRDRAALPVEVADTLRTGDKVPDPFGRVSYGQNAKRMAQPLEDHIANLNRSEAQPNAISRFEGEGGKFGQRGAIDVKELSDAIINAFRKYRNADLRVDSDTYLASQGIKASKTKAFNYLVKSIENEGLRPSSVIDALSQHFDYNGDTFSKKNQRGAINVKAIQEAWEKYKAGEIGPREYARAFKGTFHDVDLNHLLDDTNDPKSRRTMAILSPDEFLNLAKKRTDTWMQSPMAEDKRQKIREALKTDNGLNSIPYLMIERESGGPMIYGHEGRHRMDVFKEHDIQGVPVQILDDMTRWGESKPFSKLLPEEGSKLVKAPKFAHYQSGKVDIQSIKEEAEKVGKWFSSVGAKAMDNLTPKERIAINAIGDDSYIPKGDSPESIIAAAKAQPDGPSLFTQMQSGLGGAALKTDSAMMFGVNRHLQWAHKVAAKSFRELVKPIEQKLSLLSTDDAITANGILRKEMFDRKTFTDQQLRDAGASDKVIKAYKALRASFNDVYTKTNEARAKLGLEPITQQSAYYSSQWMGNWHMPVHEFVRDKNGNYVLDTNGNRKTTLSGYVKTETRAEANKAMAWIKKNMPDADASALKIQYKPENIGKNLPRDVTSTFEAMMKIFEDTPMAQQMKEMMDQYRTEQAFNERGFSKHFEEKANTRFFLGDRPWLSDKENAHAGLKSQVQYLKDAYRWIPMQEAMANIKEVLSDPDLVKNQPNNMAVTKAYVANALGVSQSIMRGLENDVAKMTGRSPSSFGGWVSGLKSLTYLQQLGMSAGYAIATPAQAFILGPSRHLLLSKEGFKYNPITTTVKALKDMAALMATHEAYNVTGKDFRGNLSPVGREALRYMEDNGIINMNLFDEYANLGENRAMNLAKNTIGATISFPEKMARTMTFISFVHHLKEGGMEIGNDMFRKAEELTNATLTEFHKNARPLIVDRMGMTGELLYTYKSPLFNFYNSLFEFGRKASETGDYKPLLTALFMTTALGGVMNFPLMQEMDGAWSLMKDFIAKHFPNFYNSVRDTGVKQFALKQLPDVLTYGAMSSVTGAQMESRFSNQIIDPENPLGNVAPVAQEIKEQAALGKFAMHPNWTTLHEGLYQNLPPAAKGFQETTADSFKAEKRPDGTTTYYNPNKLDERQAYVNRTKSDETYRKLGLTSLSEARQRDVRYASGQESMRLETARDSSMTKMFDAVVRKDQEGVQKYAIAYFKNDGNEQEFQSQLANKIMASGLTPEERQAVYLKTISDAKNILRRLQMEQKVK